jgi:serine/threonine-protein kinase
VALGPGTRLGAYEILTLLGSGGMGEVYRARDTKLNRDVAVKVLPESLVTDPERLARFGREAQVLAALNHPNIAHIHGFEDSTGVPALIMELVEGPTLADRIARGPIPLDQALPIAKQIAEGLEAAHEQGIIHRDLKPANIKVRDDGTVKILDFGLAKALEPKQPSGVNVTQSPTITSPAMMTGVGMILGTAAYMSPEQTKGRPADKRSDVWAFGCVLFEMLTGTRAFGGDDITDTVVSIARDEPDWKALPSEVAADLRLVMKRCLTKDRAARIPDLSVVRFLIADGTVGTAALPSGSAVAAQRRTVFLVGMAIVLTAVVTGGVVRGSMRPQRRAPILSAHLNLTTSPELPIAIGNPDRSIAITPDGTAIITVNGTAVGAAGQLTVRRLDQLEPAPLKGAVGARAPFISPDGRWIGYFESGALKKAPISGGPSITICRVTGGTRGAAWGPNNTIVYATNDTSTGLAAVSGAGGEPRILTKPDTAHGEADHLFPSFLPGGRVVLFTIVMGGSGDNAVIAALDMKSGAVKILVRGASFAQYAASGHLLYASGGSLRAVRFNPDRLETLSDPVVVVDQVRTEASGAAQFAVSDTGSLVYVSGNSSDLENRALVWVDRHGREQPIGVVPRAYLYPRVSPDESRVAVAIADQEQDIWILDLTRQTLTRLTFGAAVEQYPVWMPDGRHVVFRSDRLGIPNVFRQSADGTGAIEQLTFEKAALIVPYAVTPDGTTLVMSAASHIAVERLGSREQITTIVEAQGIQGNATISPNGRWLAYNSTESGQPQIYVRPFPNVDEGRWQVSTNGGVKPMWAPNGQEIFYLAVPPDGGFMAVPVRTTNTFTFGNPTQLFDGRPYYTAPPGRTYDVTPDGQKFLMIKAPKAPDANTSRAVLILDWFEELQARVPTK